jgi:adenine deaminase
MNRSVSDVGLHNAVAGAMAMIPALAVSSVFAGAASAAAEAPADAVLRDAYVYTVDAQDTVQQAVAIRDGKIVYVVKQYAQPSPTTR